MLMTGIVHVNQILQPFNIAIHPLYDGMFGNGYDFALLKLNRNSSKTPARIASVSVGQKVSALGWASVTSLGPRPLLLQRVDGLKVSTRDCATIFKVS